MSLRDVTEADLAALFEHQLDAEANYMAAFTSRDPSDSDAFMAHWRKILADDSITKMVIVFDGKVVGNIGRFDQNGEPEVGYWIGRDYWGRGIATEALRQFLSYVRTRPLHAYAAQDNAGSRRVLEKCGFILVGEGTEFSRARGQEVREVIMRLDAPPADMAQNRP